MKQNRLNRGWQVFFPDFRRVRVYRQNPGRGCIIFLHRLGGGRFKLCVSPPEDLDGLSPSQLKELVARLLDKMTELERTNAEQREEIARLKGLKLSLIHI